MRCFRFIKMNEYLKKNDCGIGVIRFNFGKIIVIKLQKKREQN